MHWYPSHSIVVAGFALLIGGACQKCDSSPSTSDSEQSSSSEPRIYRSPLAPYHLELNEGWRQISPESINTDADFAATYRDRYYAIVIPQRLPRVEGVEPPDLESLKEASLARMKRNVRGFEVEKTGPVDLDGRSGLSVFIEGSMDGERIQYVATYAIYRTWGFQLIAWGPATHETELIPEIDRLFEGWNFIEPSVQSNRQNDRETSSKSDVGSTHDSTVSPETSSDDPVRWKK